MIECKHTASKAVSSRVILRERTSQRRMGQWNGIAEGMANRIAVVWSDGVEGILDSPFVQSLSGLTGPMCSRDRGALPRAIP
jgi:hypothetical protein